jgi:protein SCO1
MPRLLRRLARLLAIALLLALAGVAAYRAGGALAPTPLAATMLQQVRSVGDATLIDRDGREVVISDLAAGADLTLVFFGFTRCPDVCPITMARLAKIYRDAGEPNDVQVVMITVDPEHDTPEVIGAYAAAFHPSFIGLSGSNGQVAVAARAFYVGYADLGGGAFTHGESVAVVDRRGNLRAVYGGDRVVRIGDDLPTLRRRL